MTCHCKKIKHKKHNRESETNEQQQKKRDAGNKYKLLNQETGNVLESLLAASASCGRDMHGIGHKCVGKVFSQLLLDSARCALIDQVVLVADEELHACVRSKLAGFQVRLANILKGLHISLIISIDDTAGVTEVAASQ